MPLTGLTLVQKGVAYSGCKIYNHLPLQIKNILNNVPLFKSKLKKFLLWYVFYSVDEYYQQNYNDYLIGKKKCNMQDFQSFFYYIIILLLNLSTVKQMY